MFDTRAGVPDLEGAAAASTSRCSEAVERAPVGGGGEAVGDGRSARSSASLGGLFGLLTILILTFYLLVEADSLRDNDAAAVSRAATARASPRRAATSRSRSARGSAASCCSAAIIGSTSAIGLWLLGIPFFYVLALISGVGELIPVVGPILSAIPAIAVAATVSLKKVLLVIVFFVAAAAVRESRAGAEGHGAAGRRQRRDRHRRAAHRRQAARHRRRDPRRADRRHPAGAPAGADDSGQTIRRCERTRGRRVIPGESFEEPDISGDRTRSL